MAAAENTGGQMILTPEQVAEMLRKPLTLAEEGLAHPGGADYYLRRIASELRVSIDLLALCANHEEQRAEIERLKAAIEAAPHSMQCRVITARIGRGEVSCDCWKSALAAKEKK